MYTNARSYVRVSGILSELFVVKIDVHQGSVLSPLLFIMLLEVLSCDFRSGCPQELLNDDIVLIAESMEELIERFKKWKEGMETNRLKINIK